MGQVLQAGAGQIPARQAAVKAGIPMTVPALTINKVCLSGLDAIALADQLIRAGEFDVIVAGGMESMTNAPHLLPGARTAIRYGAAELLDAMALDGLTDAFDHVAMGGRPSGTTPGSGITRAEQDEFAARSHQRAAAAIKNGLFDEEIVPVPVPQRKGDPVIVERTRGSAADTTAEALGKLRPAFASDGTITAGICLADLRRRLRSRGHEQGQGRSELGLTGAGRDRRARQRRWPGQLAAVPAVQRDQARAGARRA